MPLIVHYKMQIHFRYAHTYIYIYMFFLVDKSMFLSVDTLDFHNMIVGTMSTSKPWGHGEGSSSDEASTKLLC